MAEDYDNERCRIAAEMLETYPDKLDKALVDKLNAVNWLVSSVCDGELRSRQVIAVIIVNYQAQ